MSKGGAKEKAAKKKAAKTERREKQAGKKKVKRKGIVTLALPAPAGQSQAVDLLGAGSTALHQARAQWEHGDWAAILELDTAALDNDPERARLALLLAAAHSHIGETDRARVLARQALDWGGSRNMVARVLLSAAQNSMARVAAALDEDATAHFEAAIRLVQPHADAALLARSRRVRELAGLGLLPQAAQALEQELGLIKKELTPTEASVPILEEKLQMLKHELSLSLARNQLYVDQSQPAQSGKLTPEQIKSLSVSQLGQDLWVLEKSSYKRGGFFVEFGATNGILLSNTYLLEKHFGWQGLCAEPNPDYFADLQKNRNCLVSNACIGAETGQEVEFVLADEFGTIAQYADTDQHAARRAAFRNDGRTIRLRTTSLADFLTAHKAPRQIDYLSIDTEGSEFDILSAFPFEDWTIRLISVEHNFTPMRDKIRHLLEALGYQRTEAQWDDWYALPDP